MKQMRADSRLYNNLITITNIATCVYGVTEIFIITTIKSTPVKN
jgi:hypothetical protein